MHPTPPCCQTQFLDLVVRNCSLYEFNLNRSIQFPFIVILPPQTYKNKIGNARFFFDDMKSC